MKNIQIVILPALCLLSNLMPVQAAPKNSPKDNSGNWRRGGKVEILTWDSFVLSTRSYYVDDNDKAEGHQGAADDNFWTLGIRYVPKNDKGVAGIDQRKFKWAVKARAHTDINVGFLENITVTAKAGIKLRSFINSQNDEPFKAITSSTNSSYTLSLPSIGGTISGVSLSQSLGSITFQAAGPSADGDATTGWPNWDTRTVSDLQGHLHHSPGVTNYFKMYAAAGVAADGSRGNRSTYNATADIAFRMAYPNGGGQYSQHVQPPTNEDDAYVFSKY